MHPIPQGVHRLPVAVVSVGLQLPLRRQALQGLGLLGGGIGADGVENARLQHKETALDPATIALGFFLKTSHSIPLNQMQRAKGSRWLNRGEGGQFPSRTMGGDGGADVDIGNAIAVGEAEGFITHVALHPLQTAARKGGFPGIHQGDLTGLGIFYAPPSDWCACGRSITHVQKNNWQNIL